ncbi:MAG: STAS domain-containing protein [Marinilabiliaceae bacterium]|nr:STAS domain-containing protein [Marinilabiliaceae bacterium]
MSSYNISFAYKGDVKRVVISGSIIINHIEKIYDELKSNISTDKDVEIEVVADNVDITFVQLMLSMKLAWKESGKNLQLNISIPEDLEVLLAKAGINLEEIRQ